MKTNGGSDTNISSDIQWEFLIKYYNDQGFGNSTAETTATCFGHYDKDQDVDSGATYCYTYNLTNTNQTRDFLTDRRSRTVTSLIAPILQRD